jgi:hypothetical protein
MRLLYIGVCVLPVDVVVFDDALLIVRSSSGRNAELTLVKKSPSDGLSVHPFARSGAGFDRLPRMTEPTLNACEVSVAKMPI